MSDETNQFRAWHVVRLTPGRCAQCGRFVAKDAVPDVWSVDVHADYQQLPGRPNIFARTHCEGCRYVQGECSWARNVPMSDAVERAAILRGDA